MTKRILTKFSEMKHSSITRLVRKFRLPEVVAMETVAHSLFLFNDRCLSRGSSYCPETLFVEFGPSEFKVEKIPKPQDSSMK